MRKSGGIIALIAGLLGLIAAVITLFFGGIGSAFNFNTANNVINLGWTGIFLCFFIIVLGAIAMNAKSIAPGILIILSSIIGVTQAGNLVAVIMVLAFVGGVLACLAPDSEIVQPIVNLNKPVKVSSVYMASDSDVEDPIETKYVKSNKDRLIGVVAAIAVLILVVDFYTPKSTQETVETLGSEAVTGSIELASADATLVPSGELAEIFSYGGNSTDLQREIKLKEIKGKVVEWTLPVYDIQSAGPGYKIQTDSHYKNDFFGEKLVGTFINITARNENEKRLIESLKTGDLIHIKGIIDDSSLRNLNINSAFLIAVVEPLSAEVTSPSPAEAAPAEAAPEAAAYAEPAAPAETLQSRVSNVSLSSYFGKPPLWILGDEGIHQTSKKLLGNQYDKFLNNIAKGSEAGLEMDSNYFLGFGCNKELCATEQAAFAIDKQTGEMFAVLVKSEGISFFGVDSPNQLPGNLQAWYERLPKKPTP